MARSTLSVFVAVASASYVVAQAALPTFPATPLASLVIPYTAIPEQVMTEPIVRGTQVGYNICNSTTQNQQSECQTAFVNNIFDFCIWGPPDPNTSISDSEGYEVAWCTTATHGSRVIPPGTLTGVQVLNNSNYIQIVAHINQVNVNLPANDTGGELDPHGQDLSGNPQGGLLYSTAFSSDGVTIEQIQEWNMFIGSNVSATKICNPAGTNPSGYCYNQLDRLGIAYNMPNNAQDGIFEVCDSDTMQLPGVYVSNGQTLTYSQPPESLGAITTVPYTPTIPASSNCQTYQSSDLYTATVSGLPTATGATPNPSGKSGSGSSGSGTRTGSGSPASATSGSNGAGVVTISLFSTILGVAFSIAFLA
jgi:hypothetical protein